MGVVVCLLALLEMVKLSMIDLVQESPFAEVVIGPAKPHEFVEVADEPA